MRTRRTAFLLAVFAVGVVVFLRFVAIRPPAKPAISVTILGYTKQGVATHENGPTCAHEK